MERYAAMAAGIAWTPGALDQGGLLDVLISLPAQLRLRLPGGSAIPGVHASPRADDSPGIDPGIADEQLRQLLAGSGAEFVISGHTHVAADRLVGGLRALNPHRTAPDVTDTRPWHGGRLDAWMAAVDVHDQPDLRSFAHDLRHDHDAVINGQIPGI